MSRAARWLIATAVAASPLHAAEYTAAGRIGINGEHDDNVALVERGENAISGVSLAPALRLGYRTPDLTVSLDTQLNFARFDERDYDSSDQRMILDVAKQTPRNELGLQAGGVRDSTRTSELEDTGRVSRRAVRREDYWLAPSWLTYLSERNALRFGASFHDVSYGSRTYTDYTTAGVDLTWLHILSPRTTLKLQGYLNRFDVGDALDTRSDTAGVMAGADFALTENLKLSALAGAAKVETRRDLPPSVPFSPPQQRERHRRRRQARLHAAALVAVVQRGKPDLPQRRRTHPAAPLRAGRVELPPERTADAAPGRAVRPERIRGEALSHRP
jgi:opacity protein-like surface antigen